MSKSDKADETIVCPKCSSVNPSSAKFCLNCGFNLSILSGERIGGMLLMFTFIVSLASLLDFFLNTGVSKAAVANSILGLLELLGIIGVIIVLYVWYRFRHVGVPLYNLSFKMLFLGVFLIFLSYLVFYAIFFIVGVITLSPLWIVYGFLLRSFYVKYKEGR